MLQIATKGIRNGRWQSKGVSVGSLPSMMEKAKTKAQSAANA